MTKQKLIQQGAEAKIILVENQKEKFIIKDRISKNYRISELDKKIRKRRTKSEVKLLTKASKIISAPKPFFLPDGSYQIKIPYIKGKKISQHLNNFSLKEQKEIVKLIGSSIAKLHKADIIHGDLTTSNMILIKNKDNLKDNTNKKEVITSRATPNGRGRAGSSSGALPQIFFIDFGLGFISKKIEDKAVDLHLLKQALEAKHFKHWKELFEDVSKSYSRELGQEESKKIFERITAVEKRGRYRH